MRKILWQRTYSEDETGIEGETIVKILGESDRHPGQPSQLLQIDFEGDFGQYKSMTIPWLLEALRDG